MKHESGQDPTGSGRILAEIAGLFFALAFLNLLVDRSLAQPPIALATWIVLAAGDTVALYGPFLLLFWVLFKVWGRGGISDAHRAAAATTLALVLIAKGLLVYGILSGFSNR